jgi:CHAT domain-containing protein
MVRRATLLISAAGILSAVVLSFGAAAAPSAADLAAEKQAVETARLDSGADNFASAESDYRRALAIETRVYGADSAAAGETLAELALQVSNQGRFDEAAALFRRAEPIVQASASAAARARLASYQALDAANQRNYADALKFAREATAARRAEVSEAQKRMAAAAANNGQPVIPPNEGELAHSLRIEAEMALRLGDMGGAQAAAQEALWIISEEPGLPLWWRADVVSLMGEINAQQGRVVVAERDFHDARDLDKTIFGDTAPTALADLRLGQFYADQQLYPPSIDAFHSAFAILGKDRVARGEVVSDQIVPFVAAASASGDHALDADIYRASQLANSDVADQVIARVAAREAAGNAPLADMIRQAQMAELQRDTARVNLAAEYAKPDEVRNRDREDKLNGDFKQASAQADMLFAKVEQNFPDYAKLADPGPAELSAVQAQLAPGEALVSFVVGVKSSYALLVTSKGLTVKPLQVTQSSLEADVTDLRRAFVPVAGHLPDFSLKTSYSLYQGLLAPLEGELSGVDHLIVVPNGALASLPLSLLVTQAPRDGAERDYTGAAWLIRRMAVSQMPSPRAFLVLRAERDHHQPAARAFLGVGDPTFSGANGVAGAKALSALTAQCREEGPMPADLLRALPPLPDTAHEVQAVAAQLGRGSSTMLLGAQASESNFRAQALDQYRVVYFATHGLLPGELHCAGEPGLALSPPAQATSTSADGFLSASEIAQLKLNADLVVLSACNTAEEPNRFGGGALQGLADAFFASGARAVMATHWEVPSQSTTKLMIGVFERAGHQPSEGLAQALRQSQLDLIAQGGTAHPFNWAAFTIIGDGSTLGRVAAMNQFAQAGGPQQ